MAPEILEGKEYNNKCDLWSLGIIIYNIYFKEMPYKGETIIAVFNNIKALGKKVVKNLVVQTSMI